MDKSWAVDAAIGKTNRAPALEEIRFEIIELRQKKVSKKIVLL